MNKVEILTKVRTIISENIGIDTSEIQLNSHFINDLGCDSLLLAELIMILEDKFGLKISDLEAEKLQTVGNIVDYVFDKSN